MNHQIKTPPTIQANCEHQTSPSTFGSIKSNACDYVRWFGCPHRIIIASDAPKDEHCDYRLIEEIGKGGMGTVYAAKQAPVNRTVAIKRMAKNLQGNASDDVAFLLEAMITAKLDHPNIVPIHDIGVDQDGVMFYAMRKVLGNPWSDSLLSLTQDDNLDILLHVCDAVAYAHDHNLIHRDLKPDNVLLGEFGEVLVNDWGLAIEIPIVPSEIAPSRAYGSPAYMAPEMAWDDRRNIDTRTDIYLLGAILHEILTGEPPHSGETVHDTLENASQNRMATESPGNEYGRIATRAMSTNPDDRYDNVKYFQQAIRECRAHENSLRLTDEANHIAANAIFAQGYLAYSRAMHAYEEALILWPNNHQAAIGLEGTRIRYAENAFAAGDFDLAESLVQEDTRECNDLRSRVSIGRYKRRQHAAQAQRLKRISIGLLTLCLLALTGGLWLSDHQRRLILTATRDRDRAEAQLAREERLRFKMEKRSWEPVFRENFNADAFPTDLTVINGKWDVQLGQLQATGQGTSLLMVSTATAGDTRVRLDRVTDIPISIYLGLDPHEVPHRIAHADALIITIAQRCELFRGAHQLAAANIPSQVRGLSQRITVEQVGQIINVQIDGRSLVSASLHDWKEAKDSRVIISGDQGAALEDLGIDVLRQQVVNEDVRNTAYLKYSRSLGLLRNGIGVYAFAPSLGAEDPYPVITSSPIIP